MPTSSSSTEHLNFNGTNDFDGNGLIDPIDVNIFVSYIIARGFWSQPSLGQVQAIYNSSVATGNYTAATISSLPGMDYSDFDLDHARSATDSNIMVAYVLSMTFWPSPTIENVQSIYDSFVASGTFSPAIIRRLPNIIPIGSSSSSSVYVDSESSQSSPSSQSPWFSESSLSSISSLSSESSVSSVSSLSSQSPLSSESSASSQSSESSQSSVSSESSASSQSSLSSVSSISSPSSESSISSPSSESSSTENQGISNMAIGTTFEVA